MAANEAQSRRSPGATSGYPPNKRFQPTRLRWQFGGRLKRVPLARARSVRANGAAAASIRLPAYGLQSSPPANKRMEPSSVQSGLPAGGSSAAPLGRINYYA